MTVFSRHNQKKLQMSNNATANEFSSEALEWYFKKYPAIRKEGC